MAKTAEDASMTPTIVDVDSTEFEAVDLQKDEERGIEKFDDEVTVSENVLQQRGCRALFLRALLGFCLWAFLGILAAFTIVVSTAVSLGISIPDILKEFRILLILEPVGAGILGLFAALQEANRHENQHAEATSTKKNTLAPKSVELEWAQKKQKLVHCRQNENIAPRRNRMEADCDGSHPKKMHHSSPEPNELMEVPRLC